MPRWPRQSSDWLVELLYQCCPAVVSLGGREGGREGGGRREGGREGGKGREG